MEPLDMIVYSVGEYMLNNHPYLATVFGLIGMVLVFVTALDKYLPKLGIAQKLELIKKIPFVPSLINYFLRFSAVRTKKKDEP